MILRELFIALGLDVDEASFAKGQLAAAVVKSGLDKLVEVAKETVSRFVEVVKQTAETGKELIETAQSTGLTTTALQQLRLAAEESGVGTEQLNVGIFHLSRTMAAAKKGGEEQSKALRKLGTHATDAHGKLRTTDEVLMDLSEGFSKMPDGIEKTALSMEIFGRSGARLIPLLNKGRDGIEELRKEAFVMSDEQVKSGKELILTQEAITRQTTNLWRGAIGPLLPSITNLLKRYLAWKKANADIMKQRIQQYIGYVIKGINGLGNAFSFFIRNATAIKIALAGVVTYLALTNTAAIAAALSVARAWLVAAAPFIAVGAAITALFLIFDDLRVYLKGGKSLFGEYKKALDEWAKPNENDPWFLTAIKDFVHYLEEALRAVGQFNEVMGVGRNKKIDKMAGQSDKQIRENADRATVNTARQRVSQGLPITKEEHAALSRSGLKEDAFVARYRPGAGQGPMAAGSTTTNQFTIVQQPGEDSEAFAHRVADIWTEKNQTQWEETAAATGQ